jgi:rare lipoprotein A
VRIGWTQTGVASWYGVPYDGRHASSGEIFDMRKLTAAHRTLPFDTWLEVSNLENGKSVTVRINDRGPFVGGRIIDLSLAAAGEIDMVRSGTARVRLKVIRAPQPEYAVQVGAFSDRARADAFRKTLALPEARVIQEQTLWRVVVGKEMTRDAAEALAVQIRQSGREALVVKDANQ